MWYTQVYDLFALIHSILLSVGLCAQMPQNLNRFVMSLIDMCIVSIVFRSVV